MKRVVLPTQQTDAEKAENAPKNEPQEQAQTARRERRDRRLLPKEVMEILVPSLKVGAGVGSVGVLAGAAAGIVRSAPPLLFSLVAGGQWFVLGSSYYGTRQIVLRTMTKDQEVTSGDKVKASALGGGFAGMIGGLFRGPRNILPGTVVFALLGAGGQAVANIRTKAAEEDRDAPKKGFLHSKWSPVTPLTDKDYEHYLEEKLLRVEAEIAIVDDSIRELRATEQSAKDSTTKVES